MGTQGVQNKNLGEIWIL